MSEGTLFWFVVGGITAALFFGIAAVVAFRGFKELRDLLMKSDERNDAGN